LKSRDKTRLLAENELIGLQARVTKASDRSLTGLSGKIVDETLQTVTLETPRGEKRVAKAAVTLEITFPSGPAEFAGSELAQRPDERLKKLWRKA
jgi:ribonuclease P protein subunit POP4